MENTITLGGLLSVISSTKPIIVNLYDQKNLLIISFAQPGYSALEDELEAASVTKIEFINMTTINVTITRE